MYSVKRADISLMILFFSLSIKIVFMLTLNFSSIIVDLFFYFCLCLSLVVLNKYSYRQIIITIFFLLYTFLYFSSNRRNLFLLFIICAYIIKSCTFVKSLKISVIFASFTFFLVSIFILFGYAQNLYFHDYDKSIYYTFGFNNPNTFSLFLFGFLLSILILYRKSFGKVLDIFVFGLVCFVYYKTGSNTLIICFIILYTVYFLLKKVNGKIIQVLCMIFPILITGLEIFLSLNVNKFVFLDIFLTGRLSLYNALFSNSNLVDIVLGNSWIIAENGITLDNGYFMLLFSGGIIALFAFFILYINCVKYCFNTKNYFILSVIISYLFYGIMESIFTNIILFTNLLFWIIILHYSENRRKEIRKWKYYLFTC